MAETSQNGSTAVAEVALVKGDSGEGQKDLKVMNGPHHPEKKEPEMNGISEENTNETSELLEDAVKKSAEEKDQNGEQNPPETVADFLEVCKNGYDTTGTVSGNAEEVEPEVQATEEKPNTEVGLSNGLEAEKLTETEKLIETEKSTETEKLTETSAESSEIDSPKDGGSSKDVIEEKTDVDNIPEQKEELQKVNVSVESNDIENANDVTDKEISEKGVTEQIECGKTSHVNVVSIKDKIDSKDAPSENTNDGKDKDALDKEKIDDVYETSKTNQTLSIGDSNIDISMAESEDLKEDASDESRTMSIEETKEKPASKGEDSEDISLVLSESDPSLREENDISDKADHVTPKSLVNESSELENKLSKIEKLDEDISDRNGSKCKEMDVKCEEMDVKCEEMDVKCEEMDVKCEGGKSVNVASKSTCTSEISPVARVEDGKKDNKLVIKNSTSKTKSKTLDQVLSKITSIAENENQKSVMKVDGSQSQNVPKKAKARKSFAPVRESSPTINKSSITNLTFNVKELEKQGLLDIPKAQKRKAFEPMKIKSEPLVDTEEPQHTLDETNKLKSPGKVDKSSLKKKKLNRKKKGKRGGYLLPGEKARKKSRKKGSDGEMEAEFNTKLQENVDQPKDSEIVPPLRITQKQITQTEPSYSHSETVTPSRSLLYQSSLGISSALDATSPQNSVLNVLTVTNRPLPAQMPSSNGKKAKKSMKAVDSMRKIDSFFIGGNSNQAARKPQSPESLVNIGSQGAKDTEARKRKAQGSIPSPNPTPEEKKRKVEESAISPPPPQLIRLVPTVSSGVSMSKFPGSTNQILLAPGSGAGPQTIIQNGTLNGLPMFQIVNGPNGATSQPQQLVAIGPGQGQSLLQSSFPRTTNLLQTSGMAPGVPVILGPVSLQTVVNNQVSSSQSQVLSSAVISSTTTLVTSHSSGFHGTRLVPVSSVLSGQQCSGETGAVSLLKNQVYLSNGQLLDHSKLVPKGGSLPNGLYPVTPPKTPDNSASSSLEARESVELSPGGTALPDKDVIPLCTCKINGANFQKLASLVTYCQAVDSVDGKVMGCCNKVTSTQVVRPAVKVPFLSLCESHRKRLRVHQCCPGCGHFCTQGRFLQCKKDGSNSLHLFHEQCLIVKDGKNYCPHCGETSAHMEVQLRLEENKPSTMKESKSSRVQTKARITAKTASVTEEKKEEPSFSFTIEKTKKTISTENIPIGPDRHSLEKVLACLGQERPKKFRHLPKCLYTPAFDQDLERTLYMLEDGHDPNEKYEDLEFQGALHAAAAVGSLPVVHVLVQAGASPHLQDKTLRTPLMCAAENNHLDVVKYLVKAGSIVDSKADDGMTALHYAAKAGHIDVLNVLLDSEKIFVDVTDDGGWTPLIWAVEHDQTESVKLLLKRNADPNLRDSEENTTLHWAAFSGSVVIAELLLSAGCDLDSLNMHGDRPLHIAARQDHYECVVLFLARGADVEAKNDKSESPEECCLDKTTVVYLALKVNRQLKKFGAKHMGRPEKLIHRDLSKGRENIPIPCVNAFDDEGVPQDYLYVTDNIETTSLHVNRVIGSLQSCQCKDDCSSIYCACGKNSVKCWYDKFGRLVPEFNMIEPPLIFECNRACTCWTTCNNRVVQNGVMSRLQVFKTDGRGWGCKTLVDIQRGTFICEYIGEHISDSEADRREDDSYLFDLDNRDGETYCIDARKYGNIARFINHLCEPNLVPVKVFVDSQDLRFPRICLFASRDITAGEELGFDYGEKFWIIKWKHFTCTCGSNKCRYSKETIQKTLEEYYLRHDDEEAEVINEGQAGVERVPENTE